MTSSINGPETSDSDSGKPRMVGIPLNEITSSEATISRATLILLKSVHRNLQSITIW